MYARPGAVDALSLDGHVHGKVEVTDVGDCDGYTHGSKEASEAVRVRFEP